ncbi:MAG: ABC transporter permease [Caldilineaceae bacterium]|nr:ABC transporter permease [Caldilineaceae bacterium]
MIKYIVTRTIAMIPTFLLLTVFGFLLIELPPGDYVTSYIRAQAAQGNTSAADQEASMRAQYGLDQPIVVRYGLWLSRFVRGDFGDSFEFRRPATEIIGSRLGVTLTISICAFLISWGIGIPLGIYSATHQYSRTDNFLTTVTFVGLGIPDFLLGLLLLVTVWMLTGEVLTGMNSSAYASAPWSVGKVLDFLKHLWIPVTAVVITGTAWIMRVMRGNLLDQLGRPYVTALRARGLPERVVIYKHAVRNALHPLVMSLGQTLAWLISGFTIISLVLDLPTVQSIYLRAMLQQDVYLGGTILILIGVLILIGTLLADILLAWLDPRIRLY